MKFLAQKALFRRSQGFSLIELVVVVAILSILSSVAIGSYLSYKNASYDTWVKTELSRISGFLHMARASDGGFHQYLYAMGYRPSTPLRGNAGFFKEYHWENPCCGEYPRAMTGSAKTKSFEFSAYKYLSNPHGGSPPHHGNPNATGWWATHDAKRIHAQWIAGSVAPFSNIDIKKIFSDNGLVAAGSCSYGPGKTNNKDKVNCDCSSFRIMGVTASKGFTASISANDAINSHGGRIWALDEQGELCYADKDSTGKKLESKSGKPVSLSPSTPTPAPTPPSPPPPSPPTPTPTPTPTPQPTPTPTPTPQPTPTPTPSPDPPDDPPDDLPPLGNPVPL